MSNERTHSHVLGEPAVAKSRLFAFWQGGFVSRDIEPGESLVVGRADDCDVRIDHPSVSRRHIRICVSDPVTIEDLGSSNGTRVSGVTVPRAGTLAVKPGDVIELGIATVLVQLKASAPTVAAGSSPMDRVRQLVNLVAPSALSVLIRGETGVGKEVIATTLHERSERKARPFLKLNCAALNDALLESELFGHERGAFTGAVRAKPGLVEAADGGTLFLDEVGDLPLATQAKLLRVVETREVTRVGSVEAKTVDVRFLSATHRDLEAMVESGDFRQDLLYRLNGISIHIPPLRERGSEIIPLAERLLEEACTRTARPPVAIPDEVKQLLVRHAWPGNVRELRVVVERALVLAGSGALAAEHFVFDRAVPREIPPNLEVERLALERRKGELERERVIEALNQAAGNQTRAAEILGISRRTLLKRLDEYALPRPRRRD